jgi:hypothetical protein
MDMGLYIVRLVYAENRDEPIIRTCIGVVAKDKATAKLKSGLCADPSWDADYVTFVATKLATIKVKPKPREIRQVA